MAFKATAKLTGLDKLQKKLKRLQRPVEREEAKAIGEAVVAVMKDMISKGQSPVIGGGFGTRFPAYKWAQASKGDRSGRYPWSAMRKYPDKRVTPVNLRLSGDQLSDLGYKVVSRPGGSLGVDIGYPEGSKSALKEQGHREGVHGQPKRPTIPRVNAGEQFASRVQQAYLQILNAAIKKICSS